MKKNILNLFGIDNVFDLEVYNCTYKKSSIQKRGKSRESLSDAVNITRRALMDKIGKELYGSSHSMTEAYRMGRYLFGNNCYLCGKPLLEKDIQADHIVSHVNGGYGAPGNMLPTHSYCNDIKKENLYEDTVFYNQKTYKKLKRFQKYYGFNPLSKNLWNVVDNKVKKYIETVVEESISEEKKSIYYPFHEDLIDIDFWLNFYNKKCLVRDVDTLILISNVYFKNNMSILSLKPSESISLMKCNFTNIELNKTLELLNRILKYRKAYKDYHQK